jgi:hypothetical protein
LIAAYLKTDVFMCGPNEPQSCAPPGKPKTGGTHGNMNDPMTGIPGTADPANPSQPFWLLAPASMAWESAPGVPLDGVTLCANLKNMQLNGNRDLKALLHHLETDHSSSGLLIPVRGRMAKRGRLRRLAMRR